MAIKLPKEFHFSHDYAFFLHDILSDIVVSGEKSRIFDTKFEFKSKEHGKQFKLVKKWDLFDWLEENGYKDVIYETIYKQVYVAILSDFCQFIYEALKNSEKGKLVVAYTLIRKPLRENLLILEWLLSDPQSFIDKFYHEDPETYAPQKISKDRKIEIIQAAVNKTKFSEMFKSSFIYELRYEKTKPFSFEMLWHHGTHLVTTFNNIQTTRQNFNFIFSNNEDRYEQWKHFYSLLPFLLYYTVIVRKALVSTFAKRCKSIIDLIDMQRDFGFILYAGNSSYVSNNKNFLRIVNDIKNTLTLKCPKCSKDISFGVGNLKSFYQKLKIRCFHCKSVLQFEQTE